jgi:phosphoglycolate phosphatase
MDRSPPLLIFDLDDTLIESFPGYVALHQRVARELAWPIPTTDALIEYASSWRHTLGRLWPDRDIEEFCHHYDQVADEVVYDAFPGVIDALEHLRDEGHSMWVVSKRSSRRIAQRIREAGIAIDLFDGVFASEDQPAPKPDPRCFEPVWRAVGERREAIYVGDRREDQVAAQAAGLHFVAVRSGPEARQGFPRGLPERHILETAAEFPDWIRDHLEGTA